MPRSWWRSAASNVPNRDGITHVIFEPLGFIARLAALVKRQTKLECRPPPILDHLPLSQREGKSAWISKAVSFRGTCFKPKNVDCQV
jgi:hypothetical protein